ncbi:MAG: hypothetical protein LBV55_01225 [Acholeplasmatales bacterium]|jgi:hypothetical protein|nr:hypothetical protein [Acholeplasmatales bacterium]
MSEANLASRIEFVQFEESFEDVFVLHYKSLFSLSLYVLIDAQTGQVVKKFNGLGHFGKEDIKKVRWVQMSDYTPQNARVYTQIKNNNYNN